jgi:hypothetical protein
LTASRGPCSPHSTFAALPPQATGSSSPYVFLQRVKISFISYHRWKTPNVREPAA